MNFTESELREAIENGSKRAAESLFQMTGIKVTVTATDVKSVNLKELISSLDFPETSLVAYSELNHSLSGQTVFVVSEENALELASLLSGNSLEKKRVLQEIDRSAIKETLNIV